MKKEESITKKIEEHSCIILLHFKQFKLQ